MQDDGFALADDAATPLLTVALHGGHAVRPEVAAALALDPLARLREEDPCTDALAACWPAHLVATRSRFEVDLNRPRDRAVYRTPEDAWGLHVWTAPPPEGLVARSLALFDRFHAAADAAVRRRIDRWGACVVIDLHSYNHRRAGPDGPPADPAAAPDANLGTESLPARWRPLAKRFAADLARATLAGRPLVVAENTPFRGGAFVRRLHRDFGDRVCAIALEWKKVWMDEWTGAVDRTAFATLRTLLSTTLPPLAAAVQQPASQ
ncbi:MAG: N-formylglutamate amidohydrolase [Planctomycetota bacterium]